MVINKDELQAQITYRLIESLSVSEKRYETLVENLQEVVFESDIKGAFKFLNKAWESILGYSIKESLGHSIYDFVFEDDKESCLKLFDFGKEQRPRNKQDTLCFLHKKGHLLWFIVSVRSDGKGNVSGSLHDITELRETTVSKDYVDNIVKSMIDTLVVISPDGKIKTINQAIVELLGYKEEELIGKPVATIFAEEEVMPFKGTRMKKLIEEGLMKDYDMTYKSKSGEKIPVSFSSSLMKDKNGNIICIVCTAKDITKRKQAEEQIKASLKEKEAMLQEIHHRVKNNLQVISSLLNLQSGYIKGKKNLELFKDSQNRIKSIALIHEKLYQSKDLARIDFKEYTETLVSSLFRSYGPSPDKIAMKIEAEEVLLGIDSAISCGLIINELVSNSLKHAFPDGKKGDIKIGLHSKNEKDVELEVSDNGVGIPEDLDFRRTKSLGLHLVTILTEDQLHGQIRLDRKKGTKFQIKFSAVK